MLPLVPSAAGAGPIPSILLEPEEPGHQVLAAERGELGRMPASDQQLLLNAWRVSEKMLHAAGSAACWSLAGFALNPPLPPPSAGALLLQNISADVVVIGAGIAGLSCAYNLAKEGGWQSASLVWWLCSWVAASLTGMLGMACQRCGVHPHVTWCRNGVHSCRFPIP